MPLKLAFKKCLRPSLAVGAALLWFAVVWLSLEVFAAASRYWVENGNSLIQASLKKLPFPPQVPVTAPVPSSLPPLTAHWNDFRVATLPDWGVPVKDETPSAKAERRRRFAQLGEEERAYFALSHGEMVARMDPKGHMDRIYGSWCTAEEMRWLTQTVPGFLLRATVLRTLWSSLRNEAGRAVQTGSPHAATLPVPVDDDSASLDFFFMPEPAEGRAYVFFEPFSLMAQAVGRSLDPSSPWEVPYFRYKKNLKNAYSGMGQSNFSTNNFGFRGRDVSVPKPKGVFRIVCMGGSTTEEGPDDASTYPALLEKKLSFFFPSHRIEVINCGISGLTTSTHILRFPDYLELQPDLIVVYEGVNDIVRDLLDLWAERRSLSARLLARSLFVRWYLNGLLYPSDRVVGRDLDQLIIANLETMRRMAAASGVRFAVCGVACPNYGGIMREERQFYDFAARAHWLNDYLSAKKYGEIVGMLNAKLMDFCAAKHIPFIPVNERISGGIGCFGDICHMTSAAMELKAETIFQVLKEYIRPALDSG